VIPRHVIGKFSIRLVPNQMPDEIEKCVSWIIKFIFAVIFHVALKFQFKYSKP